MEKDQPDSLATVAVGSEKIPQPHSHYAPSEVYSSTEPPPAYMRPHMKSTAIQIARIAAMTMITMSVILGSFILAASWVQARASCTPESIAAMQAELKFQQQQREARFYQQQGEFLKHLQPEPLIGDPIESKDSLQRLAESSVAKKEVEAETKDMKIQKEEEDSKVDSESGDHDEDEDDYDDDGFPPVHIKLPLQLDLDDSIGTLMQQARNRISCVVERRRADEVTDGINDNTLDSNNTDAGRFQRLSGERVAILCESGNPNQQETQEQEMLTLVPLGTVQIPLQPQEPSAGYHQYQINTQYQVPDMQQLPLSNPRGLNHIPQDILSAEFRNAPRLNMEMRPPRMGPQVPSMGSQVEMRHVEVHHLPIDILRGMRPPMMQEQQQQQQPQPRQEPQQAIPVIYQHNEQNPGMYGQEQGAAMMPPPPPQSASTILEQRMIPQMMIATEQKPPAPPQPSAERPRVFFQDPQSEIEKIIQEIPSEIKNFIQHLTGSEMRFSVPEGARREMVEGLVFPVPRFPLPLRSVDSMEVPVEARAEVTAEQSSEPQQQQPQQPQQLSEERQTEQPLTHLIIQQEQEQQEQQNPQELENRPHYVQPRSVRSVPDALNPAAHRREKRMRRCACDCAC